MNIGERMETEAGRDALYAELKDKCPAIALRIMQCVDREGADEKLLAHTSVDELIQECRRRFTEADELMEHLHYDVPLGA